MGTYYLLNGEKRVGEWKDGKRLRWLSPDEVLKANLNNGLEAIHITGWAGYFNIDNMILPVGISFFTFQKPSETQRVLLPCKSHVE